jgi:hypothetical protein
MAKTEQTIIKQTNGALLQDRFRWDKHTTNARIVKQIPTVEKFLSPINNGKELSRIVRMPSERTLQALFQTGRSPILCA